jgi:hypothetical protein
MDHNHLRALADQYDCYRYNARRSEVNAWGEVGSSRERSTETVLVVYNKQKSL